jgi:hypothetical protein
MRFLQTSAIASVLLFATSLSAATPKVRRGPTAPRVLKEKPAPKKSSAQGIDPERATQIQTALIKAGYLTGTPSGTWDAQTQGAMEKLQADNGWQTKLVPDSRAIIKLGLGSSTTPATVFATTPAEELEAPTPAPTPEAMPVPAPTNK